MKRRVALLLAVAMVLSSGLTAYAAENGAGDRGKQKNVRQETDAGHVVQPGGNASGSSLSAEELERQVQAGNVGQVDVVIGNVLALQNSLKFAVKLADSQGTERTGTLEMDGNRAGENRISFEGLPKGAYTLKVSGDGFVTYSQNISVEDRACTVKLMTGLLEGINYEEGTAHPGVLLLGDVNMDGGMDEADKNAIVDSVNSGNTSGMSDLNRDGSTNLLDLDYFARSYGGTAVQAGIEESVPAAVIMPRAGDGTKVEGSLGELLREQGSVTLSREDGQGISGDSPVALEFDFAEVGTSTAADGIIIATDRENPVTEALIAISYVDGNVDGQVTIPVQRQVNYLLERGEVRATLDDNGNILIHLGAQIAVKKVTFTITGVLNNNNLAEISKVEFVNGMEERIPEPQMDIPTNLKADAGNKSISLSWDPCVNVTGYEVLIRHGDRQETLLTTKNALNVSSFGGKKMANYLTYYVSVQSVNGTWTSGYCQEKDATPKPTRKPDKPDNVSATGKYRSVVVSWKNMEDTLSYNLYYKESSAGEYQKIEGIKENGYTLTDLKDLTEYTVYVTGVNEFGESGASLPAAATTTTLDPAQMPKYNLINTGETGEKGAHIVSASMSGEMRDSALDTQSGTAWGTVDHDPASYYYKGTWDDGGYNPMSLKHGLTFEFDQAYKMDTIAFLEALPQSSNYFYAKVRCWDENGTQKDVGVSLSTRNDASGRPYFVLKLSEPVVAKKVQFGLARYSAVGNTTISEVYFYYYDELMDEIMALYADDLHTVLREDVTQATIDELRAKIQAVDPVSGEYHPDRELLERELATAETILKDGGLKAASVVIHSGITTNDVGRGFGGLNAWQPLGVTAAAGEEIMVYVGHNSKKTGEKTDLKLVATQYHAEASAMAREVAALKVGANKITIPKIWSTTKIESGGALYVQYTGSGNDQYAVRVSGGTQVPRLDLYQVTGDEERLARTENYVKELETYVAGMSSLHEMVHKNSGNSEVAYDYDQTNCILGASDILLDTMMLSLPASQILAGAGEGDARQKAQKILNSMDAMEGMMHLFYQHKGLNASAANAVDQIPKGHLNIRYQRMFSGAFMYAAGNHIGIEWGSAPGMVSSVPVQSDGDGKYVSGRYFGWGIAHEIGHCINQGSYAIAEITNNYFAVLAQAKDNNGSVRFKYENVYDKVTSGAKGAAPNVFTQLGMYWQLHLAYDKGYNYKTYEKHEEQLANLFFARVDRYARTPANAPKPGGVALNLSGADKEQSLMRLACAAAEKNILDFFVRWGKTPNEETQKYAAQFPEETRAIYYVNDESRVYTLKGGTSALGTSGDKEAVGSVTAVADPQSPHQVNLTMSASGISEADILGYEIVRCSIAGGETVRETAGFTTGDTFTDTVSVNNRVVWYEITLIDKYLNRSAVKPSDSLKIGDDGSLDKSSFSVETVNLKVEGEADSAENGEPSCSAGEADLKDLAEGSADDGYKVRGKAQLVDNDVKTVYTATAGGESAIILNLGNTRTVSGLKYTHGTGAAVECTIQIRSGDDWKTVASGTLGADTIVYFTNEDGKYIAVYETDEVKLVLKTASGSQVSIAELDVLGPTGDNVEFRKAGEDTVTIGKLTADYVYGLKGETIPKDSIVFTGSYKGNPAYNVVILYDQDGKIVGGLDENNALKAQQIILAEKPAEGNLGNVSDGTWIYWIEPEQNLDLTGLKKVRAELYRVNNALTNVGQRLVSDSLFETVPAELPGISFESNAGGSGNSSGTAGNDGSGSGNSSGIAGDNGSSSGTTGNDGSGSGNAGDNGNGRGTTGNDASGSSNSSGTTGNDANGSSNNGGTTGNDAGSSSGTSGNDTSGSSNSSGTSASGSAGQ